MKNRDNEADVAADEATNAQSQPDEDRSEDGSGADDAHETKRYERSDNLRRRSDWFRKRTGGG